MHLWILNPKVGDCGVEGVVYRELRNDRERDLSWERECLVKLRIYLGGEDGKATLAAWTQ